MSAKSSLAEAVNWQEQAHQYLVQGQYSEAASFYEQAIAAEPNVKSHYWHLGLLLLLQEQEADFRADSEGGGLNLLIKALTGLESLGYVLLESHL